MAENARQEGGRGEAKVGGSPFHWLSSSATSLRSAATLVDTIGTAAILTASRRSGVSLSIQVNYLSPCAGLSVARIEAELTKLGNNVAVAEVSVYDDASGALAARGVHVKALPKGRTVIPSDLKELESGLDDEQDKYRSLAEEEQKKRVGGGRARL